MTEEPRQASLRIPATYLRVPRSRLSDEWECGRQPHLRNATRYVTSDTCTLHNTSEKKLYNLDENYAVLQKIKVDSRVEGD